MRCYIFCAAKIESYEFLKRFDFSDGMVICADGGDVENFSVRGLKYEAEGMTLKCGEAQASSNSFCGAEKAEIEFSEGYILVIRSND